MMVSLIGFSGTGKSLLSKRLEAEAGWLRLGCDGLIEERLASELSHLPGSGEGRLAAWMGYPNDPNYREKQEIYLLLEEQVLDEICDTLEDARKLSFPPNIVVDTTGSCVYLSDDVLYRLRKFSNLVYIEPSPNEESALLESFYSAPKPIVWGDVFQADPEENLHDAIRRCFPMLMESRRSRYEELAHVRLPLNPETRFRLSGEELEQRLETLCKE